MAKIAASGEAQDEASHGAFKGEATKPLFLSPALPQLNWLVGAMGMGLQANERSRDERQRRGERTPESSPRWYSKSLLKGRFKLH